MLVSCSPCSGSGTSNGASCVLCGGDGEIDLTDPEFKNVRGAPKRLLMGVVWDTLLTNQSDMADKINDCLDKLNDIKEVVDAL